MTVLDFLICMLGAAAFLVGMLASHPPKESSRHTIPGRSGSINETNPTRESAP